MGTDADRRFVSLSAPRAAEHGVGQVRVHRGPPGGNGGTLVAVGAAIAVLSVGVLSMVLPGAHRSSRDHADSASFKQPSL